MHTIQLKMSSTNYKPDISCMDGFNALMYCGNVFHQIDRWYKDGSLNNCAEPIADLKFCFKLKLANESETKVCFTSLHILAIFNICFRDEIDIEPQFY